MGNGDLSTSWADSTRTSELDPEEGKRDPRLLRGRKKNAGIRKRRTVARRTSFKGEDII
jgi:hypothetical protein